MADLAIVVAFIAYSLISGWRARRLAGRDLEQYLLAGRSLPGWKAGTSMAATQFAADTPLLVAGLIATSGISGLWRLWIYGLAFLLMGFVFGALWRRTGVTTDAEFVEIRYSGRGLVALRAFKAIYYGTLFNCVVLAMVLVATVGIAETFLPWHDWLPRSLYSPWHTWVRDTLPTITAPSSRLAPDIASANNLLSIALILAFTSLYSMTGGLRAVVATDILQFAIAIAGTLLLAFYVAQAAGGLDTLAIEVARRYGDEAAAKTLSLVPAPEQAVYAVFSVVALQWLLQINSDGTGYLAQRTMACRSDHDAALAPVLFAWLQIILRSLPWVVIGIGLLLVFPFDANEQTLPGFGAGRELTYVRAIDELLPTGVRGLVLTAMLAALASTLDTHLNWGASYWCNDLYARVICQAALRRQPAGRELVFVARLSNIAILLLSLVIMRHLDSIQQAWQITLLFGAGSGTVLVLRWTWERVNLWSEYAAIATSMIVAPVYIILAPEIAWLQAEPMRAEAAGLAIMGLCSTTAVFMAAWLGPSTDATTLEHFYLKVKPPGAWSSTTRNLRRPAGEARNKLAGALTGTLIAAASLYLSLIGATSILLPASEQDLRLSWALLIAGLALAPISIVRLKKHHADEPAGPTAERA